MDIVKNNETIFNKISLEYIQNYLNSKKINNGEFKLFKDELLFIRIKNIIYPSLFNNLNYILYYNGNNNSKSKYNIDYIGKIIVQNSLYLFRDIINNEHKYFFILLFQGLIFLYDSNILDINYFTIIIEFIIKIFYLKIKSLDNIKENSFENFKLLIKCFISYGKFIKDELMIQFIQILKNELISNWYINIQLSKIKCLFDLLKIKNEPQKKEGLNSLIDFLIEIYKYRFTTESFDYIFSKNIRDISHFHKYIDLLIKLFNEEKKNINEESYIKHGILISSPIEYKNFNFNISDNSICFSFKILEFFDKKETIIFKVSSSKKKKINFALYINPKNFLILYYEDGNRINKKEIIKIEKNKEYLIYFYQIEKLIKASSFIIYINGKAYNLFLKVPKIKDGKLKIGLNMKGLIGPFIYLNYQLLKEKINNLFSLNEKYYEIINQKEFNNKVQKILLIFSYKNINEINPCNKIEISENNYLTLKNEEKHFQTIHYYIAFEQFIYVNFGIDFLIFQLHNITSQIEIKIFQISFQKILEFIYFLFNENDKIIQENSFKLLILSIIISINKTKIKIKFNSSIIEILNKLILFLYQKEETFIFCNILILIALNKQFYENDEEFKKELYEISFCFNPNIIIPIEIILNFDSILDYPNTDKLVIKFIQWSFLCSTKEGKLKNFMVLSQYISNNNYDKFKKKKLFYLMFIYTNLNFISNLYHLNTFLISEIKKEKELNCEFYPKINYLCYLLLKETLTNNEIFTILNYERYINISFIKAMFIQIFHNLNNTIKLTYIESNNILPSNFLMSIIFENKYLFNELNDIIKFYIKIYDNINSQIQEFIFKLINEFILLVFHPILEEKKEVFFSINKFFQQKIFQKYFIFFYKKKNNDSSKFLSKFIKHSLLKLYQPFYLEIILNEKYINEEINDLIISQSLEIIVNMKNVKDEIQFNEIIFFIQICYFFVLKRNTPIKGNITNLIITFILFLKEKKFTDIKYEFQFNDNNITIFEIILEILIYFYKIDNYSEKNKKIINTLFINNNFSIQNEIEIIENPLFSNFLDKIKYKNKSFENNYLVFYLEKLLFLKQKYKSDIQLSSLLQEIYSKIYNDISLFLSSYENLLSSKKQIKILFEQNKEYKKFINHKKKENEIICERNNSILKKNNNINIKNNKDYKEFNNIIYIRKVNSCPFLKKLKSFEKYNNEYKLNLNSTINEIITIFFYKLFPKNNEKEMEYLLNIKEKLLWKTFSRASKNYLFKNKKFKHLKQNYNSINREIIKEDKQNLYTFELPFPYKIKNYIIDDYYKPFIKPDLNFFHNSMIIYSHPYFDNNKEKNINFHFKKFFPFKKSNLFSDCELIYNKGSIYGELHIYNNYIFFKDKSLEDKRLKKNLSYEEEFYYSISSIPGDFIKGKEKDILIFYSQIKEIVIKRFAFEEIVLEFYLNNHKTYFFNFFNKNNFSDFLKNFELKLKEKREDLIEFDPKKIFSKNEYTKKYIHNEISKFKYILLINKYSTRTYNDLNQYIIFPITHLSYDPEKIRDSSKAMCLQKYDSNYNFKKYIENFKNEGYHFNIHYSTSGFIYFFLIRQNPITYNSIKFQSGNFDKRIFFSINSFLNGYKLSEDNREFLPEFFYDFYFLLNLNKNDYREYEKKKYEVTFTNVLTENFRNQFEFIIKQRKNIENFQLGPWIDNIFGINQRNENIINIFPTYSYAEKSNFNLVKSDLEKKGFKGKELLKFLKMNIHFFSLGVTPIQLFKKNFEEKGKIKNIIFPKLNDKLVSFVKKKEDKSCKIFSDKRYIYFKYENYTILNKYCGKSPIFTIHHGKQIDLIPIENSFSEVSKKFFIFVRFTDSNIKIFKKGNFIKTIKWNCIVTSIVSSELKDYFVIGDEKGFLSLLNFNEVNENILLINRQKAHFSSIRGIILNDRLDIILSFDINNIITIHCKSSFVTLSIIDFEKNKNIFNIKISNYDVLYILSKNYQGNTFLMSYTLNGLKFDELEIKEPNKIIDYFLDVLTDNVLIGTNEELIYVECYNLSKIINQINLKENSQITNFTYFYTNQTYCYFLQNNECIFGKS